MNLHKGIAATLLSLGKEDEVAKYATIIIKKMPFERSLDARYLLIRSMQQAGKNRETVDMVIALLRKLGLQSTFHQLHICIFHILLPAFHHYSWELQCHLSHQQRLSRRAFQE